MSERPPRQVEINLLRPVPGDTHIHRLWAGTKVSIRKHVATAYAAHSLSATLPGGPVFSTTFNFQQMRRFGASAAVA